ncbi:MAG: lysylphosphatidylglycerol synthase transmembrane domain-containing protein [Alphaproteobacteria bacterium]
MIKRFNKKFLIKFLLTILTFYVVYCKIDLKQVIETFSQIKFQYIIVAFISLLLAQVMSSYRMKYYYSTANVNCSNSFSIKLFFVSMFYNIIFPGGIGGDGYKIYIMSKLYQLPKLTSLKLALANRFNGLAALILLLGLFSIFADFSNCYIKNYIIIMSLLCFFGYFIMAKFILKEHLKIAFTAMKYSFTIQLLGIIAAGLLFYGFENNIPSMNYFIVFLISSILSILPISIGGAGIREVSFIYGAKYLNVDPAIGVAFSFTYFLINFILSLAGSMFVNKIKSELS